MTEGGDIASRSIRKLISRGGLIVLAIADILVRTAPELIGIGDNVIQPLLLISTRYIETGMLGGILGWLFLSAVVFNFTYLAPNKVDDWGVRLLTRSIFTISSVVIGVIVTALITEQVPNLERYSTMILPLSSEGIVSLLSSEIIVALLGGVIVLQFVAAVTVLHFGNTNSISFFEFISRSILITFALGVLLATVSLLFPLPEFFVLGVVIYHLVGSRLLSNKDNSNDLIIPQDLVERLGFGTVAIRAGSNHVIVYFYSIAILTLVPLTLFWEDAHNFIWFQREPTTFLLHLVHSFPSRRTYKIFATVSIIIYTVRYALRLIVRIPFHIQSGNTDRDYHAHIPPRIGGYLIPPALLLFIEDAFWKTEPYRSNILLVLVGIITIIAIILALNLPRKIVNYPPWRNSITDFHAAPIAFGCFTLVWSGTYVRYLGQSISAREIGVVFIGIPSTAMAFMSPYLLLLSYRSWGLDKPAKGTKPVTYKKEKQISNIFTKWEKNALHIIKKGSGPYSVLFLIFWFVFLSDTLWYTPIRVFWKLGPINLPTIFEYLLISSVIVFGIPIILAGYYLLTGILIRLTIQGVTLLGEI